jgi:hypothetical protein
MTGLWVVSRSMVGHLDRSILVPFARLFRPVSRGRERFRA